MNIIDTDVLIVGTGPCGLSAAILLAQYGVQAISINRYPGTAHTPRAHITNIRTIEQFRDMGIEPAIREVSQPLSFLSNNVMAESLTGREIARYSSYGTGADRLSDYAAASPCEPLNAPQHVMEPILLDAALAGGADVRFSQELVSIEQTDDRVLARIRHRESGEEQLIRAKYAIGADGGRSLVAQQLGVEFQGEAGLRSMVNVWIDADLERFTSYRPAVIYSILQPQDHGWVNYGTFISVTPWKDWMFVSPGSADVSEEELVGRIHRAIGNADVPIRVKNIAGWEVNHLFATQYRVGRIFLAGDAAHRHPPAGGLGTNTSVQDAYNLAWKLALVLKGQAGPGLLKSYHEERQPVGQFVVERAIKSLYNQDGVAVALGSRSDDGCPTLDYIFSADEGGLERRKALADAVAMQNYRSNALGVELGQRYSSGAIVDDGTPFPPFERDPELFYHPTTHPGAYLPHAWIEHDHQKISTVDIVGGGRFALITGIGGEKWQQAAAVLAEELGIDLPAYAIGYRCTYDDVWGSWSRIREISDGGALLVRPDRHIAWRSAELAEDPEGALRTVLLQVLDREGEG